MWSSAIVLHRPFISYWQELSPSSAGRDIMIHPLDICFSAANNICAILEKYSEYLPRLPCDIIFSIFTAGTILSHYSKQVKPQDRDIQRRLTACVRWLSIFGRSWRSATARRDLLDKCELLNCLNKKLTKAYIPI